MDTYGSVHSTKPLTRRLIDIVSHIISNGARPKLVVTRNLGPDAMLVLQQRNDLDVIVWPEDCVCDRQWLLEQLPGAAGAVTVWSDQVNNEFLDVAGPSLRVVSTMSVGYEHVDLPELAKRKIRLGYTPDVLTDAGTTSNCRPDRDAGADGQPEWLISPVAAVAKFRLGAIPLLRSSIEHHPILSAADSRIPWLRPHLASYAGPPDSIRDHRLCLLLEPLLAAGHIRDTQLAETYKLKSLRRVDIDELARESDFLFVLTPGGAATRHLVDETFLRKMKRTSILVNTSRGTVVDSEALARALREGWIWGAGLDVVEGEPKISLEHPLVKEPRCVILPHIGSATLETRLGMATLAAQNAIGGIFGRPMPAEFNLQ
ncbi:D-isomer specific 2-hydroxyacid dehydrogenase [Infundibulicybe gibba]|nr:D-isomer specific 2-hydroxyacid dehydrogenase [Infundibulicybe gibba]